MTKSATLCSVLAVLAFATSGVQAQETSTVLSGVSPIPEGATNDFCYYNGLAYSPNSYLPIRFPTQDVVSVRGTGEQLVTAESNPDVRTILLQCVDAEAVGRTECTAGGMAWAVRQNVAVSPRVQK